MSAKVWAARGVVIVVMIALIGLYAFQPGGTDLLALVSDTLFAGTALLAAVFALRASTRFGLGLPWRRAWFALALGLALWAIAELMWMYFQLSLGDTLPYPSPADFIWAVGFLPLIVGLFLGHQSLGVHPTNRQRLLAAAIYAALLALLAGVMLLPMYFTQPTPPVGEVLIGTCYLIGDMTLAFVATLTLAVLWRGLVGRPWLPIVIGFLLFAISDTVFAYAAWSGLYAVGANLLSALIDVSYLAGYLSIALGAYRQVTLRLTEAQQSHIPPSHGADPNPLLRPG